MNIIFDDAVKLVEKSHTVLELDTFKLIPTQKLVTSYCVVGSVPLTEFPRIEENKKIHQQLIENYRQQNWQFCLSAIHALMGCWNGELDSFYQHLKQRAENFVHNPPGESWHWAIEKS